MAKKRSESSAQRDAREIIERTDIPAAIAKLAEGLELLARAHTSGIQSLDTQTTVTECAREARALALGEEIERESDPPIDDRSGGSSGASGE